MAQLNVETKSREVITKTIVEEKEYILKLSPPELQLLINLLARVGGSPKNSPRKYVDSIYDAISKITNKQSNDEFITNSQYNNGVWYNDNTLEAFDKSVEV